MSNFPLRQFGVQAARIAGGGMGIPFPTSGSELRLATVVITNAQMQNGGAGVQHLLVPGVPNQVLQPVQFTIWKSFVAAMVGNPIFTFVYSGSVTSLTAASPVVSLNTNDTRWLMNAGTNASFIPASGAIGRGLVLAQQALAVSGGNAANKLVVSVAYYAVRTV